MLLRREATAQRDKRCSKSHILDQNPSFGVRRTVIYIFNNVYEYTRIYRRQSIIAGRRWLPLPSLVIATFRLTSNRWFFSKKMK